jgi:uncharacterized protein YndB with AHSA1/START domain
VSERPERTATASGLSITKRVRIEARPETVFSFFTQADKLVRWMGIDAELDPQPGGVYRVRVTRDWVARGEFVTVEPFVRVSFTWAWEGGAVGLEPGASLIEVTLEPDGEATIVHFVHSRLPGDEAVASHTEGWEHFLPRLQVAAAGGDPGPDPWLAGGTP